MMKKTVSVLMIIIALLVTVSCTKDSESFDQPKYIFLFIGDGMGINSVQLAEDVFSKREGEGLSFYSFDSIGLVTNDDADSFIPESSSSGSAISTGQKTHSVSISTDVDGNPLKSIAKTLKDDMGMKVGIVTTANLNHATPAAFYANNNSRYNYYEIAKDLVKSEFDLFIGGAFIDEGEGEESIISLAKKEGYTVLESGMDALALEKDKKHIVLDAYLDSSKMMRFAIDRPESAMSLSEYLDLAIDNLYNENGFFIMCESGKIDTALHAGDAASALGEINELSLAVEKALEFYDKYPTQTLILVTADHETGGLALGNTNGGYTTSFDVLDGQTLSYLEYQDKYVSNYIEKNAELDEILHDLDTLFGIDYNSLSEYEINAIKDAWDKTKKGSYERPEEDILLYSSRVPLTVEAIRLVTKRAGLGFITFFHTGAPVGVWAKGSCEQIFSGAYHNTEIYNKLCSALKIKP